MTRLEQSTLSAEQVVDLLAAEGHRRADVEAVLDTLIEAGLDLPQPEDGRRITLAEVQLVREDLASGREAAEVTQ